MNVPAEKIEYLHELIIVVVNLNGRIPEDWEVIYILNLYKGKDDALNTGNYMERVVDEMIREIVGRWLR